MSDYGPFLGTLNINCRIITGTQKGTIILTGTHMSQVCELQEVASCRNIGTLEITEKLSPLLTFNLIKFLMMRACCGFLSGILQGQS